MTSQTPEKTTDKPGVLRETDDDARRLARVLLRGARQMALAVIDPATGFPSVSRALTATDLDGMPVILVSALSGHTKGLLADARCSLLAGEPGKGDPLAHPRITVQCSAQSVERESTAHALLRLRFLGRHPKAALYVDFPDFRFFRLIPQSASLNGGFGRAYILSGADLLIAESQSPEAWRDLQLQLTDMPDDAARIASTLIAGRQGNWRFAGVDPAGFDLVAGDFQFRHEVEGNVLSPQAMLSHILTLANSRTQAGTLPEI